MGNSLHQIRQCSNQNCHLRFPMPPTVALADCCPRCGSPTAVIAQVAAPAELSNEPISKEMMQEAPYFEVLLDNIRSIFNVGSIFRSADGAGMRHLYLCGYTPTPENLKLAKTALGAENAIAWSYHPNGVEIAEKLCANGYTLWALETDENATSIFAAPALMTAPIVLVVGNEIIGIDPGILSLCSQIFTIPMRGQKRSLNVAIAFGVAAVLLVNR